MIWHSRKCGDARSLVRHQSERNSRVHSPCAWSWRATALGQSKRAVARRRRQPSPLDAQCHFRTRVFSMAWLQSYNERKSSHYTWTREEHTNPSWAEGSQGWRDATSSQPHRLALLTCLRSCCLALAIKQLAASRPAQASVSNYQGRSAECKQAGGDQGPKGNCNLLGHDKSNGSANPKFQLVPP